MISPGYNVRMAKGLITNFHQPRSSLLALVAAFVGESAEKHIIRTCFKKTIIVF